VREEKSPIVFLLHREIRARPQSLPECGRTPAKDYLLGTNRIRLGPAGVLDSGGTTSEEMHDEHHDTDYEQDVNDAGGNVKSEEPEQPENDENCGD
jgi:hypothetical protein